MDTLLTRVPLLQAAVKHLLPEIKPQDASKLCVVIDLDETLVHSSFKVGDTLAHPTPLPHMLPHLLCHPFPTKRCPAPGTAWLGQLGCPCEGAAGLAGVHSEHRAGSIWAGGAWRAQCSSWCALPQPVNNADFIIPVEIDGIMHQVTAGWVPGGRGASFHLPKDREPSQCSAPRGNGSIRVPALARCRAEVGAPLFAGQGGEGCPGMLPSCSGQPQFQVIQDRLWSGQSACSRLLGSGASQTLHPGHSCGAMASPSPHRQLLRPVARELLAGGVWGSQMSPAEDMGALGEP